MDSQISTIGNPPESDQRSVGIIANVDIWSKMTSFQLDEALWLSVGLEPAPFKGFLDTKPRFGNPDIEPLSFMKTRLQQFIRALDPHEFDRPLDPMTIDDWVKRVDLEIHANFREILNRMIASQGKSTSIPALIEGEDKPPTRKPDSREVNS